MKRYDLAIIGAGAAGVLAAREVATAGLSVLLLEKGAKLSSRRDLACGWFGRTLHSFDRLEGGEEGVDTRRILDLCRSTNKGRLEHRRGRGMQSTGHRIRLLPCGHYRIPPVVAATLAKRLYNELEAKIDIMFQVEAREVTQEGAGFKISTDKGSFFANRCLIAAGSRSAEWVSALCGGLGLKPVKPSVRLGVRVEMPTRMLKIMAAKQGDILAEHGDIRLDDARFGGFVGEWEDFGMVSAFGYTLPDKRSERTNFMAGFPAEHGFAEALRTARIVNVLSNDKVKRERIHDFLQGKSVLKHLPQFERLIGTFIEFDRLVPRFITTAAMYVPETRIGGALPADEKMKTALPGLYGAGECVAGIRTLLEAMASGLTAARSVMEDKDND